jgi:hypothetical protein
MYKKEKFFKKEYKKKSAQIAEKINQDKAITILPKKIGARS